MWSILVIVAVISAIIYWRGPNAVWGGATVGAVVGFLIALLGRGFQWSTVGKAFVVGILCGLGAELLGKLSGQTKKAVSWQPEPCTGDLNEPAKTPEWSTMEHARSIQVGALTTIPPELLLAMQQVKKVRKHSGGPLCDEDDFRRVVDVMFQGCARLNAKHASQLMAEYRKLPVAFEPIWSHFTRDQLCMQFARVTASNMRECDKTEAVFALISLYSGAFPTPDKICLLTEVWPKQLVQKWLDVREKILASGATSDDLTVVEKIPQQA